MINIRQIYHVIIFLPSQQSGPSPQAGERYQPPSSDVQQGAPIPVSSLLCNFRFRTILKNQKTTKLIIFNLQQPGKNPPTIPTHCNDCRSLLVRKYLPAKKHIKDGFYVFRCPDKKNGYKGKTYRDIV